MLILSRHYCARGSEDVHARPVQVIHMQLSSSILMLTFSGPWKIFKILIPGLRIILSVLKSNFLSIYFQGFHPIREPCSYWRGGEQKAEEAEGRNEQGRREEVAQEEDNGGPLLVAHPLWQLKITTKIDIKYRAPFLFLFSHASRSLFRNQFQNSSYVLLYFLLFGCRKKCSQAI